MVEGDKSEFNDSLGYLQRIHFLLLSCDQASLDHNPDAWFKSLSALQRELSTFIDDKKIDNFKNMMVYIGLQVAKWYEKRNNTEYNTFPVDLYMRLNDWESKLRKVYADSGLQVKMKETIVGGANW